MDRRKEINLQAEANKAMRSKRARMHFRAAARLVLENHYWLEDTEGEQLGMNVARNIQILTRKKPKGQFKLKEKAIMKVAQDKRTEAEKKLLRRVLGSLRCFKKYPAHVKNELAAVTYFAEYDADRKIVRDGDDALALYFVISGTCRVIVKKYDEMIGKIVHTTVKIMEAGDMFGELALLLGRQRNATIITNERTELIFMKREDFDRVLKATVLQEWDDIKLSMSKFDYFKLWDERYIQQSCMLSKMRYYDEDSLILSEDYGDKRYVYFIVDGLIDLIECVQVEVEHTQNQKKYSLHNQLASESNQKVHSVTVDLGKIVKDRLNEMKSLSDVKLQAQATARISKQSITSTEFATFMSRSVMKMEDLDYSNFEKFLPKQGRKPFVLRRESYPTSIEHMEPAQRVLFVKKFQSRVSRVACMKEVSFIALESHFIRVATMSPLATFNIGEHLDSRFYVSKTKVKLLAVPHYWLLSRDKPTWNNITIFLKTRLPTRRQLFEAMKNQMKWRNYRRECYYQIANQSRKPCFTDINDVPLSIRLKEDVDYFIGSKLL